MGNKPVQFIACGALAHEAKAIMRGRGWGDDDVKVSCLPAHLHNRPQKIPTLLREKIRTARSSFADVAVLYGDCGTGGLIDVVCAEEGVERIGGPHCYAFYTGNKAFEYIAEREVTTYYLTDYLALHFEKIVWAGLGLDKHPELLEDYFGNYSKVVYLAQTHRHDLEHKAREAAQRLSLSYEYRYTGMGDMERFMVHAVENRVEQRMDVGACIQCSRVSSCVRD